MTLSWNFSSDFFHFIVQLPCTAVFLLRQAPGRLLCKEMRQWLQVLSFCPHVKRNKKLWIVLVMAIWAKIVWIPHGNATQMLGSNSKLEGLCSVCVCVTKAQSFSHGFPRPSCNLVGLREITKIYSQFHFLAVLKKGQIPLNSKYYFKHWCNRALNGKGF